MVDVTKCCCQQQTDDRRLFIAFGVLLLRIQWNGVTQRVVRVRLRYLSLISKPRESREIMVNQDLPEEWKMADVWMCAKYWKSSSPHTLHSRTI